MVHPLPVMAGALAALVFGTAVSAAVVRSGDETAGSTVTTSTTVAAPTTSSAPTTSAPTSTVPRPTTTRTTSPAPATTVRPTPTVTSGPTSPTPTTVAVTTTRVVLTRAAATQALCREIESSVRLVAGGDTIAGGLRLLRAVGAYGDTAEPSVVSPARRMLSAGLNGDLDTSAIAAQEAAGACSRAGFPVVFQPQCGILPC